MAKLRTLLLSVLFLASASDRLAALDIWGPDAEFGGPAQSCALFAKVQWRYNTQYRAICSATVIGQTRALTAAHCFESLKEHRETVYLLCGKDPRAYRLADLRPNPDFVKVPDGSEKKDFSDDFMTLTIDGSYKNAGAFRRAVRAAGGAGEPDENEAEEADADTAPAGFVYGGFAALPVKIAPPGLIAIPSETGSCYIAGWGYDKGFYKGRTGRSRIAPVKKLEYHKDYSNDTVITYGFEGNGSAPGDSGGSLICSKDGAEYIVGVIVGGVTSSSEGYASNVIGRF